MKKSNKRSNKLNIQETFRVLANQFKKYKEEGCKCIAFTSHSKEQGKSYVVGQLGKVLAKAGHKTLIIDANFLKNTLTQLEQKSQEIGLIEILEEMQQGKEQGIVENVKERYVYDTKQENLHFLPRGGEGKDVVCESLMKEEYFKALIKGLSSSFDYILMEVPSFERLSYTQIMVTAMEGCILVLKGGELEISQVNTVKQQITTLECRMLSCILNQKEDITYKLPKAKRKRRSQKEAKVQQGKLVQCSEGITI